jgi:hypothetical protein
LDTDYRTHNQQQRGREQRPDERTEAIHPSADRGSAISAFNLSIGSSARTGKREKVSRIVDSKSNRHRDAGLQNGGHLRLHQLISFSER